MIIHILKAQKTRVKVNRTTSCISIDRPRNLRAAASLEHREGAGYDYVGRNYLISLSSSHTSVSTCYLYPQHWTTWGRLDGHQWPYSSRPASPIDHSMNEGTPLPSIHHWDSLTSWSCTSYERGKLRNHSRLQQIRCSCSIFSLSSRITAASILQKFSQPNPYRKLLTSQIV